MPRDIKHLTIDLENLVEEAISESAVEIQFALQHVSPWWTGTFASAWEISHQPVQPILTRNPSTPPNEIPERTPRVPKSIPALPTKLGKSLYVGNLAEYAGFAINEKGQTRPDFEGRPVEYWQHALNVRAAGGDITPVPKKPDWYPIYLKHRLTKDVDKSFSKAGFKIIV